MINGGTDQIRGGSGSFAAEKRHEIEQETQTCLKTNKGKPIMPTNKKIRLLIADDQEVVRRGVKALLSDTDIKIVAEATTAKEAVKCALEHDVDVVLMDVRLPDGDGLNAMGRIKLDKPDLPVLMFSVYD